MKKLFLPVLLGVLLSVVFVLPAQAGWECSAVGFGLPDGYESEDAACTSAYEACDLIRKQYGDEYINCAHVCHGITRYNTYVNPSTCPEDPADATSGGEGWYEANVAYCTCANKCDPDKGNLKGEECLATYQTCCKTIQDNINANKNAVLQQNLNTQAQINTNTSAANQNVNSTTNTNQPQEEVSVSGKVVHINGDPFENLEITFRVEDSGSKIYKEKFTGTTDKDGKYSIKIVGTSTVPVGKVSPPFQVDYLAVPLDTGAGKTKISDLIVSTAEEYEAEVKENLRGLLVAAGLDGSIADKLVFTYSGGGGFEFTNDGKINLANPRDWASNNWETAYHETGHFLMYHLAHDQGGAFGGDHSASAYSNMDLAFDEGRAHFLGYLTSKYLANTKTLAKGDVPSLDYDSNKIVNKTSWWKFWDKGYPKRGEYSEVAVAGFFVDYYKSLGVDKGENIFKHFIKIHTRHNKDYKADAKNSWFGSSSLPPYPRTMIEWAMEEFDYRWKSAINSKDDKAQAYDTAFQKSKKLLSVLSKHKISYENWFAFLWPSAKADWSFDVRTQTLDVESGRVEIVHSKLPASTSFGEGTHKIKAQSDFVIDVKDNTAKIYLIEGKLAVIDENNNEIGEILTSEPFKQIKNGEISDLSEKDKTDLKSDLISLTSDELGMMNVEIDEDELMSIGKGVETSPTAFITFIIAIVLLIFFIFFAVLKFVKKKNRMGILMIVIGIISFCIFGGITLFFAIDFDDSEDVYTNKDGNENINTAAESNENINTANVNKNTNSNVNSNVNKSTNINKVTNTNTATNANVNKPTNTNTTTNTNTNTAKKSSTVAVTSYDFTIEVGEAHADKIRPVSIDPGSFAESSYIFCYDTKAENEDVIYCDLGEAPIFSIDIMTQAQWEETANSPYGEMYLAMAEREGLYYIFSHPSGILPSDVPATQDFYNMVMGSIEFTNE